MAGMAGPWFRKERNKYYCKIKGRKFALSSNKKIAYRQWDKLRKSNIQAFPKGKPELLENTWEWYFNTYRVANKSNTIETDEQAYRRIEKFFKPNYPIRSLNRSVIKRFENWLILSGGVNGRPLSKTTVNITRSVMKTFIRTLVEEGILEKDPTFKWKKHRVAQKKVYLLSIEEKDKIIEASKGTQFQEIIPIMFYTGTARREICGEILISKGFIQSERHKASNNLGIPIADDLKPFIAHLKAGTHRLWKGHEDQFSHKFRKFMDSIGFSQIKPHDIRHNVATLGLNAGFAPGAVASLLGQRDGGITLLKTYQHLVAKINEEIVNNIWKQKGPQKGPESLETA